MQMINSEPGSHYVEVARLPWQATRFPGVERKVLWSDPDSATFTAVFRMEPGASLLKHRRGGVEQTFVLEGSLVDDDGA